MVATRKLEVQIVGEDRGVSRLFGEVNSAADGTESKMSSWSKKVAGFVGFAFATDTIIDWGGQLISAAEDAQKVTKQTEAVIASMGNAAGISATQVADLAEAISRKTGLDDEMIQSGENVLLTFGNIRDAVGEGNDIFTQATRVATDMSVAMGQDLQSSIVQVGKALNDPIEGVSALSRVGVQFSDDQTAMIQQLVATGDTLGAQKLILQELSSEFGGSAEAQATASDKLKVAWDNVQEELGTALLPAFDKVATWLSDTLPQAVDDAKGFIHDHHDAIEQIVAIAKLWVGWMERIIETLGQVAAKVQAVTDKIVGLVEKIPGIKGLGDFLSEGGFAQEGHILEGSLKARENRRYHPIPAMAAGGLVTKPTLALVGESGPEMVLPLGRAGTAGTVVIENHFHGAILDGRKLVDELNDALAAGARLQAQGRVL